MGFTMAASIFEQIKGKEDTREAVMLMAVGLAEMAKELEELSNIVKHQRQAGSMATEPKHAK